MIYAAIVDDDGVVAEELASYLERYARESGTEFEADRFSNPVNFLTAYSSRYDVVFLDIDMPDMNGMDVARRMRAMDEDSDRTSCGSACGCRSRRIYGVR